MKAAVADVLLGSDWQVRRRSPLLCGFCGFGEVSGTGPCSFHSGSGEL